MLIAVQLRAHFLFVIWNDSILIHTRTDCDEELFSGSNPDGEVTLAVIAVAAALLFMIVVVVFVPLHSSWLWVVGICCRRCFLQQAPLNKDPRQQYTRQVRTLEMEWEKWEIVAFGKRSETFEGSSPLT